MENSFEKCDKTYKKLLEKCERRKEGLEMEKENGRLRDKIKELEEIANWHIEHLTEDIADYIDDDKVGNASIIGDFKEEREHWRDINRILNNKKTYIDYKNY